MSLYPFGVKWVVEVCSLVVHGNSLMAAAPGSGASRCVSHVFPSPLVLPLSLHLTSVSHAFALSPVAVNSHILLVMRVSLRSTVFTGFAGSA